jgi:hypothetical protein
MVTFYFDLAHQNVEQHRQSKVVRDEFLCLRAWQLPWPLLSRQLLQQPYIQK